MGEKRKALFPHNTPNEVAAAPPILAVAFSSLLTICYNDGTGPASAPTLPSEPQREITNPHSGQAEGA